jgi:uncharacterized protein (TIGR02145 family)
MANTPDHDTNDTWDNPDYQESNEDDNGQKDAAGNNLWKAENNPCPAGWRLPTYSEWQNVRSKNTWPTASGWVPGKFNAVRRVGDYLYLPATGYRLGSDGSLKNRGNTGYHWSSSAHNSDMSKYVSFVSNATTNDYIYRTYGFSVRCVVVE